MLPFEFIIPGPPRSQQTRHRVQLRTWKDAVREAASKRWPIGVAPDTGDIRIIVQYVLDKPRVLIDGDKLLKPIQDALIGLVYDDDRQITDAVTQKRPIDDPFFVRHMSMVLAEGFAKGDEFVYVRVEQLTDRARIRP
jgi:crossover junction endodeoxyribonuclease RusA